jgi:hypothetical protein
MPHLDTFTGTLQYLHQERFSVSKLRVGAIYRQNHLDNSLISSNVFVVTVKQGCKVNGALGVGNEMIDSKITVMYSSNLLLARLYRKVNAIYLLQSHRRARFVRPRRDKLP